MSDLGVVWIARCPVHGLHGERTECFVCGGEVEQVPVREVSMVGAGRIETESGEWLTVRDAMRELNRRLLALERGDVEKLVLMAGGRMRAVVLTVDRYAELTEQVSVQRP